ncbi:TRAF-like family protein [Citrus sinensis]|uniref:TRAF-like family protein n=1 Tax=Citrus sinensis TaxID=2711 RepID=A0ACB8KA77_CITSI|nr:TRAF-like family protein [Citrus sinensis]
MPIGQGLPPAHYTLEIKKYSQLSKAVADRYESAIFKTKNESQECNWRLILYPNGNKKGQGTGHISLYLALDESTYFPNNSWEVYVNFTFFVQDRIKNEYLAIRYDDGAVIRLHSMKRECGIDKLIPLQAFKEPSNGYLVDDSCVFGAEIFVIKPTGKGEAVSIVKVPAQAGNILRWKIANFSNLRDPEYCSSEFNAGGREWRIVICPMGDDKDDKAKGNYLSFYIRLQGSDDIFQSKRKLFAEYKMRVLDHPRIRIDEQRSGCWFSSEMRESGYPCFMSLDDLHKGGYLYGDTLIVEVEFLIVSVVKDQKLAFYFLFLVVLDIYIYLINLE